MMKCGRSRPIRKCSSSGSPASPAAEALHLVLLRWYDANRREMPWRDHPDPYAVWVSEIMLQQTQVETVRGYFSRFVEAFPSVAVLAEAPQQDVLKKWEGLGYYSRARNLQRAAQVVSARGGRLPQDVEGWRALPGVGPYTAAAIASICFGVAVPVVDGNVIRVFARFLGWADDFKAARGRVRLAAWLQPWVEASGRPGDFNQAMMDLGATVCVPRTPACQTCPLNDRCVARREGRQAVFPSKPERKRLPLKQAVAVLLKDRAGRVLFVKRPEHGLLGGLWELPNLEVSRVPTEHDALRVVAPAAGVVVTQAVLRGTVAHVFSHFRQHVYVFEGTARKGRVRRDGMAAFCFAHPDELPLTTVARRALTLCH